MANDRSMSRSLNRNRKVNKQRLSSPQRLVSQKGGFNVVRLGASQSRWGDSYHLFLTMSWPRLLGLLSVMYITLNALFALAYLSDPALEGGIANAHPKVFWDAFFFSVQTMASIGYGAMYPRTIYTNAIVTVESLLGLLWLTMAMGLMFARFSRPTARVLFSQVAVIAPQDGLPTLMFRAANQRGNQILEAQLRLTLVRNVMTEEGEFMRRFYDMRLSRSQSPIFALTWTAMHPIDEHSPLYGITAEELAEVEAEVIVTLIGLDDSFSQTIHARHSYIPAEIIWNMRFADIITRTPDGRRAVDYTHFHQVVPLLRSRA
jgi:inward rectifier potassium channel